MKRLFILPLLLAACASAPELESPDSKEQARAGMAVESITGLKLTARVPVYHFSPGTIRSSDSQDVAHDSVVGFYDPDTRQLFMTREAIGTDWHFGLRVHETTHALQDQLFGLNALDNAAPNTDAYNALQALIEGHAESVMSDAMGIGSYALLYSDTLENGLSEIQMQHGFEYGAGLHFVRYIKARGGYEAVHAVFSNPPASTEQILHPQKYPHEQPDEIAIDMAALRAAVPGWKFDELGRLGEYGLLSLLMLKGEWKTASRAAAGWGGDATVWATRGDKAVVISLITWDTPQDSEEFRLAVKDVANSQCWIDPANPRVMVLVLGNELGLAKVAPALLKSTISRQSSH